MRVAVCVCLVRRVVCEQFLPNHASAIPHGALIIGDTYREGIRRNENREGLGFCFVPARGCL